MAKKKIGCAEVHDGVARGWFTIPEKLKRGVYELLGEYQGNEVYKPSYDLKYLIIGLGTEIQGIQAVYQVDEYERKLTVTGRLVGYNEMNEEVGLENEKISFKLGEYENPLKLAPEERAIDAVTLLTPTGEANVTTGDDGFFEFQCYVPPKFNEWEYQLYVKFDGNYEYVSCVEEALVRVGFAPTVTYIEVFPSNHLHPESGIILRASVYLEKDIDAFGVPKTGASRITAGNAIFKWSDTGQNDTWDTMRNNSYKKMTKQDLDKNDGWIIHRYMWGKKASDVFQKYFYCQYSGSREGIGYKPSKSRVVHVTVDEYGDRLDDIRMQLATLDTEQRTVFYVYGENPDKQLTFDYGAWNKPVPIGFSIVSTYEED